jgi:hypothetical protein
MFLAAVSVLLLCTLPGWTTIEPTTVLDPMYSVNVGLTPQPPSIDWVQKAMFVTTQVRPHGSSGIVRSRYMARKMALELARTDITAALATTHLTDYTTIGDAVNTHVFNEDPIPALVAQVRPAAETWDEETKTLTLVSVLPLYGDDRLTETAARLLTIEQQTLGKTARKHTTVNMSFFPSPLPKQWTKAPYTGVILDCRGMKYTPVLLPKLVTRDGMELWGTVDVNTVLVGQRGVATYAYSPTAALKAGRVGARPLLINPIGTCGTTHGDLILRPEDAVFLLQQEADGHFLSTLSITIILDKP